MDATVGVSMTSRGGLLTQLHDLTGCETLTDADLQELGWHTKHRIFLALLAELPEGSDAVMACAQLQAGKSTRNRQSENPTRSSTDAYRKAESQLRTAFFAEVGRALESMGAPPAVSAPKKLRAEAGVCLRAISFLAARVRSRQQRGVAPSAGIMDESEMGNLCSFGGGSSGGDVLRPAGLPTMKQPRPYGRRRSTKFSSSGGVISTVSTSFETPRAAARCVKTPSSPHTSLMNGCEAQAGETPKPRGKSSPERREFEILEGGSLTLSPIPPVVTPGMVEEEETTSTAVATFEEGQNTQHQSGVIGRKDAERGLGEEEKGERESASQNYAKTIRERPVAPATPTGRPLGRGRRDDKTRDDFENDVTPTVVVYPASSSRKNRRGVTTPGICRENPHRDSDISSRGGNGNDVSLEHDDSGREDRIRSVRPSGSLGESSSRARGTPPSILPRASRETPQRDSAPKVRARGGLTSSVSREARRRQDIGDSYGGSRDDGSRVGDAVGLEIGTTGVGRANRTADAGGSVPKRRASLPHSPPSSPSGASADLANMEKTVAQNVFLRRRVEELQELVDSRAYTSFSTAAVEGRGARGGREKRDGRRVGAENLETPSEAAACEIILRGQVEQLRRQVRLQHCAVDASAAVTREVKAVLVRLEAVLIELASLGESSDSVFDSGDAFHGCKTSRASTTARAYVRRTDTTTAEEKVGASRVAGGAAGAAALPAWNQLLHRVETLSRQVRWAERAAQRAVDGRIHVTRDSSAFLKPHARGQRRPRDLRVRVLDPDHFTCPPPTHGAVHQRLQGALPVEGYASVVLETPASPSQSTLRPTDSGGVGKDGFSRSVLRERGQGGSTAAGEAERAAEQAEQATAVMAIAGGNVDADADTAVNIIPGIHQMYHLDAASVHGFGEAAAAATRSLEALLSRVSASAGVVVGMRDCGRLGNGKRGNDGQFPNTAVPCRIPPPGVVSMLTDGGGDGNDAAIVDAIASVRDSFRGVVVAAAALGAVAPCAPEGAGAASEHSSSPALRLLRGVKAVGGTRGARRVETLAIRLRAERAALEASAADAAVEAREWREAARQHAAAVLALAQGLRAAWKALIRKVSAASRALAAILDAMGNLSRSPEATAILRGSAGPFAAALLQTLSLFEPDLEDTASGMAHHLRRCEGEISRLWEVFEEAHLRNGGNVTVDGTVEEVGKEEDVDKKIPSEEEGSEGEHG